MTSIDDFEFDCTAALQQIPFPSLSAPPSCFRVVNGAFNYQRRGDLETIYDEVLDHWNKGDGMPINVVGTLGYGVSHILAALAFRLLKEREQLKAAIESTGAVSFVLYIPDCQLLKSPSLAQTFMQQAVLLNCPDYQGPLHSTQEIAKALSRYDILLIADEWSSIDDSTPESLEAKKLLDAYLLGNTVVKVRGMTASSLNRHTGGGYRPHGIHIHWFGGFSDAEYQEWLAHQSQQVRELYFQHPQNFRLWTGLVPLWLFEFSRLYQAGDTLDGLVEKVVDGDVSRQVHSRMATFYAKMDPKKIWQVYTSLPVVYPSLLRNDLKPWIDGRFFYEDIFTGWLVPSGGILLPMLFQVWRANVANDSMLQVWPDRLEEVKDRRQCECLVKSVLKAKVLCDGIAGVYSKPFDRSILPFSFQPGTEATSFVKAKWLAQTASHPKSKLPWILMDPDVFNCGGVDMILVTDESVVGVNVTIAGPPSDMTEFFQVWKSIAQENSLTMESGRIVLDDTFV
ncbi:unnamed protein product, partial [Aphanomyces euteiches]